MAQIIEEQITIKVSRLVKNEAEAADAGPAVDRDVIDNLQAVCDELIGGGAVVEVTYDGQAK